MRRLQSESGNLHSRLSGRLTKCQLNEELPLPPAAEIINNLGIKKSSDCKTCRKKYAE